MKAFKANASVIFTDATGCRVDTFVIFDSDPYTGLTHINHENLKVHADRLELHKNSACEHHMPLQDAFSFEMIRKLRDKYAAVDKTKKSTFSKISELQVFSQAS
ncbi:hypothetical protein [Mucilaginibacter agri]|uniref:Uncharacterized protein n=1 Tax=Mucilaginibacter agri TaxID=2695265 RepID=A0A965ZCT2_9SPHI|nr:hypothetical protein [Mucilaginibacter agri]NCD68370.1 hypothetical protein [Mucilaginibacter agri]